MNNTSFSINNKVVNKTVPRMVTFKFTLSDCETGEIYANRAQDLEVFGSSRSFENRLADVFACFVRGLRVHKSLSLSVTVSDAKYQTPLDFFPDVY